ncbi:MAG: DUF3332 domain-containing protein [Prevotellaceae bacterium]|nr:DUF3332 domain-containing protein [Prevotella sp.]MDD7256995.1 DUF3332 domain-containing protein [Prevotellaceae bacterium]MDY6130356.1 DUF3332 domain-containing protein [Prevotella sp.]
MKRKIFNVAFLLMAGGMVLNSCIGSYTLFNKFAKWETRATDSKFLNAIIGVLLLPVNGVCLFVDAFILNTIEFWTGSNPMAQNIGKTQRVMGGDGLYYAVKTLKNGYEITKPDGQVVNFTYNEKENAWYMVADGKITQLFRFNGDGTIQANLQNGRTLHVTPDAQGLYDVRMAVNNGLYFAAR